MSELKGLMDQVDDLDSQIAELQLTDEQIDEITTRRDRLQKQVIEGIVELGETNPDLAAKLGKDFADRAQKWMDYYTSTRLRVLKAVRMLKVEKGELITR